MNKNDILRKSSESITERLNQVNEYIKSTEDKLITYQEYLDRLYKERDSIEQAKKEIEGLINE